MSEEGQDPGAVSAGWARGKMIVQNVLGKLAPSRYADSSSSTGRLSRKLRRRKRHSGIAKPAFTRIRANFVSYSAQRSGRARTRLHHGVDGNQDGGDQKGEHQTLELEIGPRKGVGSHGIDEERTTRGADCHDQGGDELQVKLRKLERQDIPVQGPHLRQRERRGEDLLVCLERRDDHPDQREQGNGQDERNQEVKQHPSDHVPNAPAPLAAQYRLTHGSSSLFGTGTGRRG